MLTPEDLLGLGMPFERPRRIMRSACCEDESDDPTMDIERAGEYMAWLRGRHLAAYKVVGMHFYLGFTFEFIGEVMGFTDTRASQLFNQGINLMRARFAPKPIASVALAQLVNTKNRGNTKLDGIDGRGKLLAA